MHRIRVLFYKHYFLRRKYVFFTLIQILLPIFFMVLYGFAVVQYKGIDKEFISNITISKALTTEDIFQKVPFIDTKIYYAPKTNFTDKLINNVRKPLSLTSDATKGFKTETDLLEHFNKTIADDIILGLTFRDNVTDVPMLLDYDIRIYNKGVKWHLNDLYTIDHIYEPGKGSRNYLEEGFIPLQLAVGLVYANMLNITLPEIVFNEFAYPPHWKNALLLEVHLHLLPLVITIGFVILFPGYLIMIVDETYSKLPHLMKAMGRITTICFQIGWFIDAVLFIVIDVGIITILLIYNVFGNYSIISHCNGSVLFTFLMLYSCALMSLNTFFSWLIWKPLKSIAVPIAVFYWVLSFIIPTIILNFYTPHITIFYLLSILFPNAALGLGFKAIFCFEAKGETLNWNKIIDLPCGCVNDIKFLIIFIILIGNIFTFIILPYIVGIIYINCKCCYTLFTKRRKDTETTKTCPIDKDIPLDTIDLDVAFELTDVSMEMHSKSILKNFNFKLYKNKLTVLTGKNGAGKSSLISILTGRRTSTSGTIKIKDVSSTKLHITDKFKIGICYQDNYLHNRLTVLQHLILFAMMNGGSMQDNESKVNDILDKLQLDDMKDRYPDTLSGGYKRRVCLGLAIINKREILLFDEPTAGMDLNMQRKILNILHELKKDTTILLATHDSDDFRSNCDFVAFMGNGEIEFLTFECLTTKYGLGPELELKLISKHDLDDFLLSFPDVHLTDYDKKKSTIKIRYPRGDLKYLLQIFKRKKNVQILNYRYNKSVLHLSEAFLEETASLKSVEKINPVSFTEQWAILFEKRWQYLKTHFAHHMIYFLIAIIGVNLMLSLSKTAEYVMNNTELKLTLNVYQSGLAVYQGPENIRLNYNNTIVSLTNRTMIPLNNIIDGISSGDFRNLEYYRKHLIIGMEFNNVTNIATVMYSSNALHGAPISLNAALNSFLTDGHKILTINKPLKSEADNVPNIIDLQLYNSIIWCIILPLSVYGFLFTRISFPYFECNTKLKKLQFMAGVNSTLYWTFTFIYDYFLYLILITILNVTFFITINVQNNDIFYTNKNIIISFNVVLFWTGTTGILFAYLFSYHDSRSRTIMQYLLINLFVGLVWTGIQWTADIVDNSILTAITYLSSDSIPLFPPAAVMYFITYFVQKNVWIYNWDQLTTGKRKVLCNKHYYPCCNSTNNIECTEYMSPNGKILNFSIIMFTYTFLFLLLLVLKDASITTRIQKWTKTILTKIIYKNKYDLVRRIETFKYYLRSVSINQSIDGIFNVENLCKIYFNSFMVNDVSFEISRYECLGLLGGNGAGKTTIFKILCGNNQELSGEASITISEKEEIYFLNTPEYCRQIGYCPQVNFKSGALTATILLETFGRLRGLKDNKLDEQVNLLLKALDLNKNEILPHYSGGMKRKLSLGIALIGNPPLLLLDEPTAGIDKDSCERITKLLQRYKSEGGMILLTSHSLKDCHRLCDRVMILHEGQIVIWPQTVANINEMFEQYFRVIFEFNESVTDMEKKHINSNFHNHISNFASAEIVTNYVVFKINHISLLKKCIIEIGNFISENSDDILDTRFRSISFEELFEMISNASKYSSRVGLSNILVNNLLLK